MSADADPVAAAAIAGLEKWVAAQKSDKPAQNFFEPPTQKMIEDLERTRAISKELQEKLPEMEKMVRVADEENSIMNPSAVIPDYVEDHEYVTAKEPEQTPVAETQREETPASGMQKFFSGQRILITGGTGFLGKVLIEKLLRTCYELDTIYVLIRPKKGKEPMARLAAMLDDFLFERAAREQPKCLHKVVAISGDVQLPGLGLSPEDRKELIEKVSIIINSAATVKFDEKINIATKINVLGTKAIIQLARECKSLKAVTHVSTAFANCTNKEIEERFYEPPITAEALENICSLKENILEQITPKLLGRYPNTYCFTKAVAEDAVRRHGEGMPVCIVRPGIVISTLEEPVRGWTDNMYGPTGIMVGVGTGVLRTIYMDASKKADLVPVDYTVNAIIAATYDTGVRFKPNETSDIPIYNFVSSPRCPMTWGEFIEYNEKSSLDKPTMKAVWYYGMVHTKIYPLFLFYNFFLHFVPAVLADTYLALTGQETRVLNLYRKLHRMGTILTFFALRDWKFSDDNTLALWRRIGETDRTLVPFNMADMSWKYHTEMLLTGLRVYLVKDPLSTLPEARKKWQRMYYMHQSIKLTTLVAVCGIMYYAVSGFYSIIFS